MIFVIVPAYNEEERIGRVVRGLFEHGFEQVVVVDDGSADNTASEAVRFGATVIRHALNRGQGAALQTGNEFALKNGAKFLVHFDGDGQFNPADIMPAIHAMEEKKADAMLGSRFLDSRSRMPWTKKYIVLPISRFINRIMTGMRLTDAHNGFRVLSRKAAQNLYISQDGMAHNSEIVQQLRKGNYIIAEHPVEVLYYEYGQGIDGGMRIVGDIIKAKLLK